MYVLVTRVALNLLPDYRSQIESLIKDKTGLAISIGTFSSSWEGLDPVLNVNGLSLDADETFQLKSLQLQLAFWPSVLSLRPKFERVLLEDAEMVIRQKANGRWFIVFDEFDFELPDDEQNQPTFDQQALMKYLAPLNGTTLNLKNINATLYKQNGSQRELRLPKLNVNYKDDQIYASGQILESQGQKALLNFSLHGRGLLSAESLKGTLYAEARSAEFFNELLSIYDWQKVSIQNVEAASRAWINFEDLQILSVYGDMQVRQLNWKIAEKSLPPLNDLVFSYFWQQQDELSQLSFYDLGFEWANQTCDHGDIKIQSQATQVHVQAEKLKLQCISRLLMALDLPSADLHARLFQSNPKGYLRNVHITLAQEAAPQASSVHDATVQESSDLTSTDLDSIGQERSSLGVAPEALAADDQPDLDGEINTSKQSDSAQTKSEISEDTQLSGEYTQAPPVSHFQFEAQLDQVNINAYEGTPSGKNLSGYIYADAHSGYVSFMSEGFELGFPDLFLAPWAINRAEGRVNWVLEDEDVTVYSEGLRLWRDKESLIYGDFLLRLNPDDQEDYLALSLGLQNILFTDVIKFVPYHAVDQDLYEWLKASLKAGNVSRGVYFGYGSIEDDDQENSFTSSIHLVSEAGVLKFDPAWPPLEKLNADINIQNGQLNISASSAAIANSPLTNLTAYLPEKQSGKGNALNISAKSRVKNGAIHYWLSESPIADVTRPIAEQLLIDASALVNLQLAVPVAQSSNPEERLETAYHISVNLDKAAIDHIESKLSFSEVKGTLKIDSEKGVEAKDIRAKLFNKPVKFAIESESVNSVNDAGVPITVQFTRLLLDGSAGIESIFNYLGYSKPPMLSGDLAYAANLSISDQEKQYPLLTVRADLTPLVCDCPVPFTKTAPSPAKMDLSLLLKPEQSYLDSRITAPGMPEIKTELLLVEGQPYFGEILLGDAKVSNTQIKGLNIAANLGQANLQTWLAFIEKLNLADPEEVMAENDGKPSEAENNAFLKQVQLNITELNAYDYLFRDAKIKLVPDAQGQWQIDVKGVDANGIILLAKDDKPLNLNLANLNLVPANIPVDPNASLPPAALAFGQPRPVPVPKETSEFDDPRELPRIQFKTSSLLLDGRSIGNWQFDTQPDSGGLVIKNLQGYFKGVSIDGQINWRYEPDTQRTIATLSLAGANVESVFEMLDLPLLINSERFTTDVALVWPDAPHEFALSNLSGRVSVLFESGFIRTEDEKTGALRLFGVLNAESIKRRLKLDFSDLYKSGVGYDIFKGGATLDNGLLSLTEPLSIEGPAGSYLVNGRSDLATKALDFDMLVELPFSQNFPLAALVLGAPQVGGLVWVADKLLGEPLSALTTSRYDITGTWEEPRVDLHQAVNASKKDRTQEKGMRDSRRKSE